MWTPGAFAPAKAPASGKGAPGLSVRMRPCPGDTSQGHLVLGACEALTSPGPASRDLRSREDAEGYFLRPPRAQRLRVAVCSREQTSPLPSRPQPWFLGPGVGLQSLRSRTHSMPSGQPPARGESQCPHLW